jgi:hypothetical protein
MRVIAMKEHSGWRGGRPIRAPICPVAYRLGEALATGKRNTANCVFHLSVELHGWGNLND